MEVIVGMNIKHKDKSSIFLKQFDNKRNTAKVVLL